MATLDSGLKEDFLFQNRFFDPVKITKNFIMEVCGSQRKGEGTPMSQVVVGIKTEQTNAGRVRQR